MTLWLLQMGQADPNLAFESGIAAAFVFLPQRDSLR